MAQQEITGQLELRVESDDGAGSRRRQVRFTPSPVQQVDAALRPSSATGTLNWRFVQAEYIRTPGTGQQVSYDLSIRVQTIPQGSVSSEDLSGTWEQNWRIRLADQDFAVTDAVTYGVDRTEPYRFRMRDTTADAATQAHYEAFIARVDALQITTDVLCTIADSPIAVAAEAMAATLELVAGQPTAMGAAHGRALAVSAGMPTSLGTALASRLEVAAGTPRPAGVAQGRSLTLSAGRPTAAAVAHTNALTLATGRPVPTGVARASRLEVAAGRPSAAHLADARPQSLVLAAGRPMPTGVARASRLALSAGQPVPTARARAASVEVAAGRPTRLDLARGARLEVAAGEPTPLARAQGRSLVLEAGTPTPTVAARGRSLALSTGTPVPAAVALGQGLEVAPGQPAAQPPSYGARPATFWLLAATAAPYAVGRAAQVEVAAERATPIFLARSIVGGPPVVRVGFVLTVGMVAPVEHEAIAPAATTTSQADRVDGEALSDAVQTRVEANARPC